MNKFLNIAGYKFVAQTEDQLKILREQLFTEANRLNIKGTILLSEEGINAFVAGSVSEINQFRQFITSIPPYSDIIFKDSFSDEIPFSRMLVRIKNEIITMGHQEIKPENQPVNALDPATLKQWYNENREFTILDTRNDYEVALGTFDNAIDLNIENFREFPDAVTLLPDEIKSKPVVTFCTGGIRCEKAALYMQKHGFKEVYLLQGGILNYFSEVGGEHYHGECFVFDKRISVDPELNPTETDRCYAHTEINTAADLQESLACPYCLHLKESRKTERVA